MARLTGSQSDARESEVNLLLKATDQAAKVIDFTATRVANLSGVVNRAQQEVTLLGDKLFNASIRAVGALTTVLNAFKSIIDLVNTPIGQGVIAAITQAAEEALQATTSLKDTLFQLGQVGAPFFEGLAGNVDTLAADITKLSKGFADLITNAIPTKDLVGNLFNSFFDNFAANKAKAESALKGIFDSAKDVINAGLSSEIGIDLSGLEKAGINAQEFLTNIFGEAGTLSSESFNQKIQEKFGQNIDQLRDRLKPLTDLVRSGFDQALVIGGAAPGAGLAKDLFSSFLSTFQSTSQAAKKQLSDIFQSATDNIDTQLELDFGSNLNDLERQGVDIKEFLAQILGDGGREASAALREQIQAGLGTTLDSLRERFKPLGNNLRQDLSEQLGLGLDIPTDKLTTGLFESFIQDFNTKSQEAAAELGKVFTKATDQVNQALGDRFGIDLSGLEKAGIDAREFLSRIFGDAAQDGADEFDAQLTKALGASAVDISSALAPIRKEFQQGLTGAIGVGGQVPLNLIEDSIFSRLLEGFNQKSRQVTQDIKLQFQRTTQELNATLFNEFGVDLDDLDRIGVDTTEFLKNVLGDTADSATELFRERIQNGLNVDVSNLRERFAPLRERLREGFTEAVGVVGSLPTAISTNTLFNRFLDDFARSSRSAGERINQLFGNAAEQINTRLTESFNFDLSALEEAGIDAQEFIANIFGEGGDEAGASFNEKLRERFGTSAEQVREALSPIENALRVGLGAATNAAFSDQAIEQALKLGLGVAIKNGLGNAAKVPGVADALQKFALDDNLRSALENNFAEGLNAFISDRLAKEINAGVSDVRKKLRGNSEGIRDLGENIRKQLEGSLNLEDIVANGIQQAFDFAAKKTGIDTSTLDLLKNFGLTDTAVRAAAAQVAPLIAPLRDNLIKSLVSGGGSTNTTSIKEFTSRVTNQVVEQLRQNFDGIDEQLLTVVSQVFTGLASEAARNFALGFSRQLRSSIINAFDGIEASLQKTLANISELPQSIQEVTQSAESALGTLNGISEPIGIFTAVKSGATQALGALSAFGEQIFFLTNGLQVFQQLVTTGPFRLLIGQTVELREQLLSTQAALVSTNLVIQNGVRITDNTQAIQALTGPVNAAISQLRRETLELVGVTSKDLIPIYQQVANQITTVGGGLTDAVDLSVKFAATLGTLQIPLAQSGEEIRSILQGTVDQNTQIAKSIGLSNQMLQLWISQDTLVDNLNTRLEAFAAGNALAARTLNGLTSNIQEVFEEVSRIAGSTLVTPLVDQVLEFYEAIQDQTPVFIEFIQALLDQVARISVAFRNSFLQIVQAIGPILEELPLYLFTSAANLIEALARAVATTLKVLGPFLEVLAAIVENLLVLQGPFLEAFVLFKTLTFSVGLASTALDSFSNILPGIGELLFLLRLRTTGVIGQFTNLANVTTGASSAFILLLKNLDKVPFAAKALRDQFGPLSGIIQSFAPQVGSALFTFGGLASASEPLRNVFKNLIDLAPNALNQVGKLTSSSTLLGGALSPLTPLFRDASRAIGAYSTNMKGSAAIADLLSQKITDVGKSIRVQAASFALTLGAAAAFIFLLNEVVIKSEIAQAVFGAIGNALKAVGSAISEFFSNPLGLAILTLTTFSIILSTGVIPLLFETGRAMATAFATNTLSNISAISAAIANLGTFILTLGDTALKVLALRFPQLLEFLKAITVAQNATVAGAIAQQVVPAIEVKDLSLATLSISKGFTLARAAALSFFIGLKENALISIGIMSGLSNAQIITGNTFTILRDAFISGFQNIGKAILSLRFSSIITALVALKAAAISTFAAMGTGILGVIGGFAGFIASIKLTFAATDLLNVKLAATNANLIFLASSGGAAAVTMTALAGGVTATAGAAGVLASVLTFITGTVLPFIATVLLPLTAVLTVLALIFDAIGTFIQKRKDLNQANDELLAKVRETSGAIAANNKIFLEIKAKFDKNDLEQDAKKAADIIREATRKRLEEDRNFFTKALDFVRKPFEGVGAVRQSTDRRLEDLSKGFDKQLETGKSALTQRKEELDQFVAQEEKLIELINQRTKLQEDPDADKNRVKSLNSEISKLENLIEDNKAKIDDEINFLQTTTRDNATSDAQRKKVDALILEFKSYRESLDSLQETEIEAIPLEKLGSAFRQLESNALAMEKAISKASGNLPQFEQRASKLLEITTAQLELGGIGLDDVLKRVNTLTSKSEASFGIQIQAQKLATQAIEKEYARRTEIITREQEIVRNQQFAGVREEFEAEQALTQLKVKELEQRREQVQRNAIQEAQARKISLQSDLAELQKGQEKALKDGDKKTAESFSNLAKQVDNQTNLASVRAQSKLAQELKVIETQIARARIEGEISSLDKAQKAALDQVKKTENFRLIEIKKAENALSITRVEAEEQRSKAATETVEKEIRAAQIKLSQLRQLFNGREVPQVREQQLTLQGLVLKRLELEEDAVERTNARIKRDIQSRNQIVQNSIQAEIQAFSRQKSALDLIEKGLQEQNKILQARKDLVDAQSGLFASQLNGLSALEQSDFRRQQLQQVLAANQLRVAEMQLQLSNQVLENEIKQNRLALEREAIENRRAAAAKRAEIAQGEADILSRSRDRDVRPEELEALRLAQDARKAELTEIGNLGTLIQDRFANLDVEESTKRLIGQLRNNTTRNTELINFYNSLRPAQQAQVRDQIRERLFETFQATVSNEISVASKRATGKESIEVNGVNAGGKVPAQVVISNGNIDQVVGDGFQFLKDTLKSLKGESSIPNDPKKQAVFLNDKNLEQLKNILSPERFDAVFKDSEKKFDRNFGDSPFGPRPLDIVRSVGRRREQREGESEMNRLNQTLAKVLQGANEKTQNNFTVGENAIIINTDKPEEVRNSLVETLGSIIQEASQILTDQTPATAAT